MNGVRAAAASGCCRCQQCTGYRRSPALRLLAPAVNEFAGSARRGGLCFSALGFIAPGHPGADALTGFAF